MFFKNSLYIYYAGQKGADTKTRKAKERKTNGRKIESAGQKGAR